MSLEKRLKAIFKQPKKGETHELRSGLVSGYRSERKDAIKQVIAAMTTGKDVSSLFPDVVKNIATRDLEEKKLIYLYLMNYATTNPELCILAVNTFVQDALDPNPLVRSLAIRTMGCINVDKILDYIEIPLGKTLHDDNPYVRKTAALCVAKLYKLDPEKCEQFMPDLVALLEDENPMVVANTVVALQQINLPLDKKLVKKLLTILNECSEWCRITVLNALAEYRAGNDSEARNIVDRVSPQLQHVNPAVVMGAIKCIVNNVPLLSDSQSVVAKLAAPIVSMMSTPPEIQYVALRNIRIILEAFPQLLAQEHRVFYCKYNDPLYLKVEKIDLMVRIAQQENSEQILAELKEYALDIDTELVSRSINAMGQLAIKVPSVLDDVVIALEDLFRYDASIVVLADLLRAFPELQFSLPQIEHPTSDQANAAYLWIISQYPGKFDLHILRQYVAGFVELGDAVQLAVLHCLVRYALLGQDVGSELQTAFKLVTESVSSVDVRDQCFIYMRLLSGDASTSRKVVLGTPVLQSTIPKFEPELLQLLLRSLSTLASVYHSPVGDAKVTTQQRSTTALAGETLLDFGSDEQPHSALDELTDLFSSNAVIDAFTTVTSEKKPSEDLLDLF